MTVVSVVAVAVTAAPSITETEAGREEDEKNPLTFELHNIVYNIIPCFH